MKQAVGTSLLIIFIPKLNFINSLFEPYRLELQQNKETPKTETADDLTSKLQKLKSLFDAGLIEEDEFKTKKAELLSQL